MAEARLRASLGLDSSGFSRGIDGATSKTRAFQSQVVRVGATIRSALGAVGVGVSFGAMIGGFSSVIRSMSQVADAADNLGVTTDALQALKYAAADTGNEFSQIEQALAKVKDAASRFGEAKMAEAWKALGISVDDVQRMKPEDLFARIGASLNSSNASQKEFNAANDIFGTRIGPRLMAMLREIQGSAGLDGYIAKAREAGAVVAEETVRMADAFDSLSQRGILKLKALAASGLGALVEKMKGYNPMWGRLYEAVTPPAPATQGAAGARFTGEPIAPTVPDPAGAQRSAVVRAMERQAAARQAFDATIKTSGFSRDSYDKVGGQIGGASRADMVSVGQAQLRALNEANELARELIAAIESNNNNGGQL